MSWESVCSERVVARSLDAAAIEPWASRTMKISKVLEAKDVRRPDSTSRTPGEKLGNVECSIVD